MDERVNDFMKEINDILPDNGNSSGGKHKRSHWKKCIDDNSGFPYYWNVKTDEVTWEAPSDYEDTTECLTKVRISSLSAPIPDDVKIYRISEENAKLIKKEETRYIKNKVSEVKLSKVSLDSKETPLVSSYGSDPEIEEEENTQLNTSTAKPSTTSTKVTDDTNMNKDNLNKSSGFLLVAGYGGESEEEQEELVSTTSHSTLFPIVEPVDVSQFTSEDNDKNDVAKSTTKLETLDNVDIKPFQRKRRIDVPLIDATKKITKLKDNVDENEETKIVDSTSLSKPMQYPGFRSGGVLFSKEENDVSEESSIAVKNNEKTEEVNDVDVISLKEDIAKNKDSLKEKLSFLNEGRDTATVIQTMLIQMETLYEAYDSGNLTSNYLSNWLNDIAMELVKLEQDATPTGWLLQWDRSQKRYFYCNIETGQTQWHYPVNDVNVSEPSDDAMDISTTPPPPDDEDKSQLIPPPPPRISKTLTPPTPLINSSSSSNNVKEPVTVTTKSEGDASQLNMDETKNDSITSALNSFYSDIAAIETKTEKLEVAEKPQEVTSTNNCKKKKVKVKLSQGLSMKKKGVSKLVEKWKNLQHNYD